MSLSARLALSPILVLLLVATTAVHGQPHLTATADDYLLGQDLQLSTGTVLPAGTRWYRPPDIDRLRQELVAGEYAGDRDWARQVVFGYEIMTRTWLAVGPQRKDGRPPLTDDRVISCTNCHAQAGTVPDAWPFFRTVTYFGLEEDGDEGVFFSGLGYHRDARIRARDCVQECGGTLVMATDSAEMDALVAWMKVVRDGIYDGEGLLVAEFRDIRDVHAIPGATTRLFAEILDMRADPGTGREIYRQRCAGCHGADGLGVWDDARGTYLFPPLAGPTSFSDVGGPSMIPVGAAFLHRNMPLAELGSLSKQEALDVMGHIATMERNAVWWQDEFWRHDPCARSPFMPLHIGVTPEGFPFSDEQTWFGPWRPIAEWLTGDACRAKNPPSPPRLGHDFDPRQAH